MDANGTFFHLLLGKENWGRCLDSLGQPLADSWDEQIDSDERAHLAWDSSRGELTLEPHIFLYTAAPGDHKSELQQRRGAACDRYGNFYWIDETQQKIRIRSVGSQQASDFWPVTEIACPPSAGNVFEPRPAPVSPSSPSLSGLTVTDDHYLVVGVLKQAPNVPAGLLVFDLVSGEPPMRFLWPKDVDFAPFDMAPRPNGGIWVLDKDHKRYWALDRSFSVLAAGDQPDLGEEVFQPVDPSEDGPKRIQPHSVILTKESGAGAALPECVNPIAIEALPDCTVLILDDNDPKYSSIFHYDSFGGKLGGPISLSIMENHLETDKLDPEIPPLRAHDFAFTPVDGAPDENKTAPGRLYIASQNGNQVFVFTVVTEEPFKLEPVYEEGCMLMRLFSSKALVPCAGQVFYDIDERWVPLVNQPRLRYSSEDSFSSKFDGKQPGCVWHRLSVDACIPPDTQVQIWSRAADEEGDLVLLPWQLEHFYLRGDGSELPFAPNPFLPPTTDENGLRQNVNRQISTIGAGTWELLFQRATGRYLQIRVRLAGQGQRTPRLREMRIYYPRFSYLEHYLPAVYRADPESASFLDRYLANTEGFYTAIEDKIAAVRQLFDVASAPPEALDWLAGWFGAALHPGWDDTRRRLFIRHAALLFQYRGTLPGLQMALRLALDDCPGEHIFQNPPVYHDGYGVIRIVEAFLSRRFVGSANAGFAPSGDWNLINGSVELHRRYQVEFATPDPYPIREPGGALRQLWRDFSQRQLGFVPDTANTTPLLWQAYLLRTYGEIDKLNIAYKLYGDKQLDSFDEAIPPEELPKDGAPLEDWVRFESTFLPLARNAHQFFVLLPMPASAGPNTPEYQRRLDLAVQMVELEKPAHTTYALKFFWALFTVGEARLGLDTMLNVDSRSVQLAPVTLGRSYLGQSITADDAQHGFTDRVPLSQGCSPNVGGTASVQKMTVKRYPYLYGCTTNF